VHTYIILLRKNYIIAMDTCWRASRRLYHRNKCNDWINIFWSWDFHRRYIQKCLWK